MEMLYFMYRYVLHRHVHCNLFYDFQEENFTAQSLLLHGYGAVKELNESSHFSLIVVFFGLKHFSFVSPKIP